MPLCSQRVDGKQKKWHWKMVSVQVPNIDLNSTRVQEIHDIQMSNLLISCTERSSGPVLYTYIFISLKREFLYRTHKPQYLANLSDVTN